MGSDPLVKVIVEVQDHNKESWSIVSQYYKDKIYTSARHVRGKEMTGEELAREDAGIFKTNYERNVRIRYENTND